ncbi:focadhesin [Linepithema humile]|uniref:focadhesin n=1 Tax=Linepithema humile TaxID=83485 RepID=UPI0006239AC7|nr:PREDICTED: focadhesin [Linepithema humile]
MDEIECNLKSENPILISYAISILNEIIKKKYDALEEKDISKIPEFKFLTSKCINHENPTVVTSTCQGLVTLAETGLWNAKLALATLTSMCSSKNYEAIIVAISQLLTLDWRICNGCSEYTLQLPNQHPFIIILKQNKRSGICVVNQMKQIMYDDEKCIMEHSIEILRPVFLYIICDPVSTEVVNNSKSEAWQLVIKSNKAADLQMEILLWLCTNREDICVDSNCRLIELAEISMQNGNTEYCTALAPLIASVTIQLLECNHNPQNNFFILLRLIKSCDSHIGNLMISLMAEIILICPNVYLSKVFRICALIVEQMSYDTIFLNVLSVPLLTWLVYKIWLCPDEFKNLLTVIKQRQTRTSSICDDTAAATNKILRMISRNNKYILFYTEQIRSLHSLNNDIMPWLENLSLAPIDLKYTCKLILCGIFLYSEEPLVVCKTWDILLNIAKQIKSFESHVMSLVNHKLTVFHDSASTLQLLKAFPQLGSMRIITSTLQTMQNSGRPLSDVTFEFYITAIKDNPRCYRFLSNALMEKLEQNSKLNDWRTDVVCANTIKRICESHPEHGEELVPLLSLILNRCADTNGGAASALALDAISSLCKSAVIGIYSTWKVLARKMRTEKRTMVLESLCDLFANIPSFPFRANDDHEKFIAEIATELWRYAIGEDTRVAEAAFKALKSYPLELVPLSTLPLDFRSDLVVPSKNAVDKSDKSEDALQYIPGSCWIQMLKKVNRSILPAARDLLIFYIENELTGFRSRIYNWPQGEPQNFKFLPERSVIRAIGEHLRRSDKTDSNNRCVIMECLRVFNYDYKKPLPNIKWDFLEEIMKISDEAKELSLSIVSRHCRISQSAKSLTERFLSMHTSASKTSQLLLNEKHLVLYSHLDELFQAFQPNSLQQFLETSIDYFIDRILQKDEKSIDLFNWIMSAYGTALKSDLILIGNRTLLSTLMERVFEMVELTPDQDFSIFEIYYAALMHLTVKDIERITSPNIWWTETTKKLRNAIAVRTKLAFSGNFPGTPVTWLSEIIETAASSPEMQRHFLESMQRVQTDLRLNKSFDLASQKDWIVDFMNRIALIMSEEENVCTTLYLDILFVSVICLSGLDCLLPKKELLITSQDDKIRLFPLAISVLIDRQIWKSASFQIMKWLNYMRTNCLISDVYVPAFQSALILLRGEEDYLLQWTNYLSSKTYIDL